MRIENMSVLFTTVSLMLKTLHRSFHSTNEWMKWDNVYNVFVIVLASGKCSINVKYCYWKYCSFLPLWLQCCNLGDGECVWVGRRGRENKRERRYYCFYLLLKIVNSIFFSFWNKPKKEMLLAAILGVGELPGHVIVFNCGKCALRDKYLCINSHIYSVLLSTYYGSHVYFGSLKSKNDSVHPNLPRSC